MSDPANAYLFDRWSNWMTGAFGFTFAREEQASHPESRVFNISQRSPGYYVSSWIWGLNQGPSFGPLLAENHLLYKQYDRSALPEILNTADVIFYSPVSGRHQDWKLLREWLQTPGKTLVTHSNTPFLFDDGLARLTPGTENVNYTDINQRYSDFLMEKADFKSVVFPEFRSLRPLANGVWSTIPGASVLSDDKTNPLLSSLLPSHGSRIFYLHKNPLHLSPDERDQVVRILMEKLNLSRSINTSSVPVMAHRFVLPEAEVLNVWTGVDIPGFRGGYGSHLFPGRGADTFDRRKRPYPWLAENRQVFLEIPVNEPGTWRVYAFLSGKEQLIEAGPAKTLRLEVNNVLAEQFYYARDSLSIREKIESLKKRRERLFPWCPDIPR
jgi:hypothetical protein